ncbi:hypothetical protein SPRG_11027 [Saprolegnia parasitica CBS 223.65]|uniref:RING-type domain-containing protein n=1 Tax=Saprolegnia parasitica (strain CBS 223.65) TaxID=695850 RepID=A0A067BWU0_SAPPC|nr:hypothetical protein SPRG_11027 [Saprolegnia parasitica CBS 223.65]KDO22713.1 hypothetical protein SPRG_11027 [Saprolegnia parasitica CBS 223.65]|eukprot:XP_012206623.1 hypothetical protein SPRG_11027 [Saprolegnia parasitica CBS 223.65]
MDSIQVREACDRRAWVRDGDRSSCKECIKGFSVTRRRHHCRVCGDIVCHSCSATVYLLNTTSNVGRACHSCARPSLDHSPPRRRFALTSAPWCESSSSAWHADCVICLDPFTAQSDAHVVTLPCQHAFHRQCADPWLATHDECPTCRRPLAQDRTAFLEFIFF